MDDIKKEIQKLELFLEILENDSEQLDKKYPSDYLPDVLGEIVNVVKNTIYSMYEILNRMNYDLMYNINNTKQEMKQFVTKNDMDILGREIQKRFDVLEKRVKSLEK